MAEALNIPKLAIYEPPFMADSDGHHPPPADALQQLKELVAADRRSDTVKFFLKDEIGLPGIAHLFMKLMPVWSKLKAVAHTPTYNMTTLGDFSPPQAKAASIKIPTLVSGGDKSQVNLRQAVKKLVEVIPNSRLEILEGQTHNVSPKVLAPVLTQFFEADSVFISHSC